MMFLHGICHGFGGNGGKDISEVNSTREPSFLAFSSLSSRFLISWHMR